MKSKKEKTTYIHLAKAAKILTVLLLAAYFSTFFLYQQRLTNLDFGKLVKYGEIILKTHHVFETNYFSYTYPNYPFINHHWGTGVVFYLIHQIGGLDGLTLFALIMNLVSFWLIFSLSARTGNFWATVLLVMILMPMLTSRYQPRPEDFSIFFFTFTLYLLFRYRQKQLKRRYLWLLPFIQLLWVNVHILFFLGIFLQGVFFLDLLVHRAKKKEILFFLFILILSTAANLVNPSGLQGALYPFRIMHDIHYGVAENTPLIQYLLDYHATGLVYYYEIVFFIMSLLLYYWVKNPQKAGNYLFLMVWTVAMAGLLLWRIRAGIFFAYVLLLLSAAVIRQMEPSLHKTVNKISLILLSLFFLVVSGQVRYFYWSYLYRKPGMGVDKHLGDGAAFYKRNKLHGPIFNNFDVGDYLIYYLYPNVKVFVDSRPEAYPAQFMTKKLVPAFYSEKAWLNLNHEYRFNVVFLGYNPQIKYLVKRLYYDSDWFLAYYDNFTIIFLKMNEQNRPLIRQELINGMALQYILYHLQEVQKEQRFPFR